MIEFIEYLLILQQILNCYQTTNLMSASASYDLFVNLHSKQNENISPNLSAEIFKMMRVPKDEGCVNIVNRILFTMKNRI